MWRVLMLFKIRDQETFSTKIALRLDQLQVVLVELQVGLQVVLVGLQVALQVALQGVLVVLQQGGVIGLDQAE